ncbi:bifunctional diguanylate cyclase/phosphodiesterase [Limimaricola sp.]|uniref:putative bifunctional diguanylate cyclase/phosphodiesterase n=1 Tax=Limimaricola sp. TaxID=2211665 RepID=UPI0025C0F0BD|nr:bifunctional diguanylate cyclase/phosphodiesterase [Limimaricola sp.]
MTSQETDIQQGWRLVAASVLVLTTAMGLVAPEVVNLAALPGWQGLVLRWAISLVVAAGLLLPMVLGCSQRSLHAVRAQRERAEARLRYIARHDRLTDLRNRDRLLGLMAERLEAGECLDLVVVDLDRFKPINDLHGHKAGDRLLCAVADRIRALCGPADLPFRLDGGKFAMLIAANGTRAEHLATALSASLARPFDMPNRTAQLGCRIGIARSGPGLAPADIVQNAEDAMHKARATAGAICVRYDLALRDMLREKASFEADLREAIAHNRIVPYFQPIYAIDGRAIVGFEVLSRWLHPVRGFVPPDRFIALAEDLGLLDRLSDQVLRRACAAMARLDRRLDMSFNISPSQFGNPMLPGRIKAILDEHGIAPAQLEIEITEHAVVSDVEQARHIIAELIGLGIRISLDDFGTGQSSLATLSQFPFQKLKIDRSFIASVDSSPQNAKIVSGVLALAASLNMNVTAEGIESEGELEFLRAHACGLGQGYLFSRPLPEAEFELLVSMTGQATAPAAVPVTVPLHRKTG